MLSWHRFFLLTFLVTLLFQGSLWKFVPLVDATGWTERISALAKGNLTLFTEPLFANPNMAMLVIGALADQLGFTSAQSLRGSTALLNAIAVAGAVTLAYILRPRTLWWGGVGAALISQAAYFESTPHDAILAPWIVLAVLVTLYIIESKKKNLLPIVLLGICSGISLATFFPLALLFLTPLIIFLGFYTRTSMTYFWFSTAVTLVLFDPLWLLMPRAHWVAITSQTVWHGFYLNEPSLPWLDFFQVAPLALLGLIAAIFYFLNGKKIRPPVPRHFLALLLLITFFVSAILLNADYQTFRAFHPLFFLWEVFLPLWLVSCVPYLRPAIQNLAQKGLMALFISAEISLFIISSLKLILHP